MPLLKMTWGWRPWAQRLAWALGAWLLLWALAWLVVPPLVRSQGERLASEALGRRVTIERVAFAPWSLELVLHGIVVAPNGRGDAQLAVQRVRIDAEMESIFRLAPVVDALEIDAPVLRLAQTSPGHWDVDDIRERLGAPQDAAESGEPLRFALYNIVLRGGAVDVQDATVQSAHTLRDVELRIPFLSNLPAQREVKVQPHLAFKLNGSSFDSSAEATPFLDNRQTQAHLRLKGFDLAPLAAYIPRDMPFTLQSGVLDMDVKVSFEQKPQLAVHVRGGVQASGVRVVDRTGQQTLLAMDEARVQIADLEPLAQRVQLELMGVSVQALALNGWDRPVAAPPPFVRGRLDADVALSWRSAAAEARIGQLTLEEVFLQCPAKATCAAAGLPGIALRDPASLAEIKSLRAENIHADMPQRTVQAERVLVTQPRALVERDKEGRWMFEHWLGAAQAGASGAAAPQAPTPWGLRLGVLELDGGALALRDALPQRPVTLGVTGLRLHLTDFAPLSAQAGPIELAARVAAGRTEPGRLEYKGQLALAPVVSTHGQVLATRLPLHALEPYVAQALNVRVLRADGSFQGAVQYQDAAAGPTLRVQGDAALDDLRVRSALLTRVSSSPEDGTSSKLGLQDDLLNWKTLGLRGVDVALQPGQAARIEVRETALSDFFARIIVQENGRINLQDVLKQAPNTAPPEAAAAPAVAAAAPAVAASAAASSPVATAGGAEPAPVVRFGPIALTGGRVRFSDNFIKPHYSADLGDLTGRLSAFSSEASPGNASAAMADLELRGRAEGTAQLEIVGQINPLARPLALDIQGHMRDLELPPLTPYAVKYAGHGIERGKLGMDVRYTLEPNGQLSAHNKLVLKQLAFGAPVEGAPASLPVRLAVALLADRNGVIDLDLPISGSLNDPQFRLGAVFAKLLGNLVAKAVTAPFALLAGAFGGTADLSTVAFAPGSALLDDAARQGLDKVAQALAARPALTLTVVGQAQLASEREGWKKAHLHKLLQAQKRREAVRNGQDAATVAALVPQEVPALLKEVYRRADIAKPRNLVGLAKELPQAEMEALLLASIPIPDEAMQELAVARAVAVRDYLVAHQAPAERLFVGAVNTKPTEGGWTPRAELTLAMK